jgi:hypothetical protein
LLFSNVLRTVLTLEQFQEFRGRVFEWIGAFSLTLSLSLGDGTGIGALGADSSSLCKHRGSLCCKAVSGSPSPGGRGQG